MGRQPKYVDKVEQLLDDGWTVKDIVNRTNIGRSTVYNVLTKLKKRARYDFKNLMTEDYLWQYQKTLENFTKTIRQCNEKIDTIDKRYDAIQALTMKDLENTPETKHMARATLINNLITIQSNRTNELQKMVTARDKAADNKARVYNAGPVVNSIDEWVRQTNPAAGEVPRIDAIQGVIKKTEVTARELASKLNTDSNINDMSEEDLDTINEMKEDE